MLKFYIIAGLTFCHSYAAHGLMATDFYMELGALGVQNHKLQFSKNGSSIDLKTEGAQEVLFAVSRFEIGLDIDRDQKISFVYQPLTLNTQAWIERDIIADQGTFNANSALDIEYSFPFYRISWMKLYQHPSFAWGLGGSLQIRNASITLTGNEMKLRRVKQNIGPVPLLKGFYEYAVGSTFGQTAGIELDTIYAPVKYINGSDSDVVGALTDLKLYYKQQLSNAQTYGLFIRYLGGGAQGTNTRNKGLGDGYSSNWLDFAIFGISFEKRMIPTLPNQNRGKILWD
jgi:hypothetical protein